MNKIFVFHFIVSLLVLTIVGTYAEDSGQIMGSVRDTDNKLPDKEIADRTSGKSSNDNKDVKAYGILHIKVLDSETLEPLGGVAITIEGYEEKNNTDMDGRCLFRKLLPGNYKLKLKMFCFDSLVVKNIKIEKMDTTNLVVKMKFKGYGGPSHDFGKMSTNNFGVIKGKVINKYTKEGIYKCNVLVKNTSKSCITDTFGNFMITGLISGKHKISVQADTYYTEQYDIKTGKEDVSINIFMLRNRPKQGYGILYGKIFDRKTDKPIPAVARSDKLQIGAVARDNGYYVVSDIPMGEHEFLFALLGYIPLKLYVNIKPNEAKKLDVKLKQSNIELN